MRIPVPQILQVGFAVKLFLVIGGRGYACPPKTHDAFGRIYEYFLGKFAMSEVQKGGEFFTPTSIVKLIVEIIEPYHGRIYESACVSVGH